MMFKVRNEFIKKWEKYLEADKWNVYGGNGFKVWGHSGFQFVVDLVPKQDKKVLEIGCADGYMLYLLNNSGFESIGLTYGENEKNDCASRGLKAIVGDMHDLPFNDNEFDAIVARQTFEHALSPVVVLNECNRVLKLNGHTIIHVPNSLDGTDYTLEYHHCAFTATQWRYYLYKSGFKKILQEGLEPNQNSYFIVAEKTDELIWR